MSWGLPVETVALMLLGSARMVALLSSAPIFGHIAISSRVRGALGLAVMLAVPLEPAPGFSVLEVSSFGLAGALAREIAIGLAIGFGTRLLFAVFSLFGEIVSIEAGLSHARVLDPNTGATSVALASLFDLFVIGVFFAVGGHQVMLETFQASFTAWPIGGGNLAPEIFLQIASLGGMVFSLAMKLAMPIVVAITVSNLALGILARAVPQLNLMMLQLPAHVLMGLAILSFGSGVLLRASGREILDWSDRIRVLVVGGV